MTDQLHGIGAKQPMFDSHHEQKVQNKTKPVQQQPEAKPAEKDDRVSLQQPQKTEQTYGPIPGVEVGTSYELLRALVVKTLEEQGIAPQVDTGSEILDLQKLTPEEAQELVADDGYFGVEKTSDRIVDFAIHAFGNDPAKLAEMKAAIEDGFQQAADAFGGSLPEISHQTYDLIMEKLDSFAGLKTDPGEE